MRNTSPADRRIVHLSGNRCATDSSPPGTSQLGAGPAAGRPAPAPRSACSGCWSRQNTDNTPDRELTSERQGRRCPGRGGGWRPPRPRHSAHYRRGCEIAGGTRREARCADPSSILQPTARRSQPRTVESRPRRGLRMALRTAQPRPPSANAEWMTWGCVTSNTRAPATALACQNAPWTAQAPAPPPLQVRRSYRRRRGRHTRPDIS
jgi:hypothetical protein